MNTNKQIQLMVGLLFVLVAGLLALTLYESTRAEDALERQTEEQIERGARLFGNNCAACHGLSGEGFVGPALDKPENRPSDPVALRALREKLRNTITCGRVGTFMPAWAKDQGGPLNNDQIRQLVTLITTDGDGWHQATEHAEAAHVEPTQPTPDQINQGACGQVLKEGSTPDTGTAPDPKTAWDVDMADNVFRPRQIAIPVGQQATFSLRNSGTAIHNMRIAGPDGRYDNADDVVSQPDTVRGGGAGTLRITAAAAGTLRFRCDFHPTEMTGTLTAR